MVNRRECNIYCVLDARKLWIANVYLRIIDSASGSMNSAHRGRMHLAKFIFPPDEEEEEDVRIARVTCARHLRVDYANFAAAAACLENRPLHINVRRKLYGSGRDYDCSRSSAILRPSRSSGSRASPFRFAAPKF